MRLGLALLLAASGPASAALVVTPVVGIPGASASAGASAASVAASPVSISPLSASAPLLAAPLAGTRLTVGAVRARRRRVPVLPAAAAGLTPPPPPTPAAAAPDGRSRCGRRLRAAASAGAPPRRRRLRRAAPPTSRRGLARKRGRDRESESVEDQAARSESFFDQAARYEHLGAETLAAMPEGALGILAAVRMPPSEVVGDDGGGTDYPHRDVKFNGKTFPSVAFRPNTPVEALLISAIDASKTSIRVALYEFSSRNIFQALQRAKRRGVNVQVILDYSNSFPENEPGADYHRRRSEQIWGLVRDKFDVRILRGVSQFGINHNKFGVFDGKMAEFGSYNWSYTSEHSHYENANFSIEKPRVAGLNAYYDYLWERAVPEAQARMHVWSETVPDPPADASPSVAFNGIKLPLYVFTPGDKLEDVLVSAIDAARTSVDYAMFSPRSAKVAQALKRAADRGLRVRAVIDESQSQSEYFKPFVDWLALNGVEVKILSGPNGPESDFPMAEKMHNKFMILDGKLVETGSANHTKRASLDNYENTHFLDDATDAAGFNFHFKHLWAVARPIEAPASAEIPTDEQLREDILHPTIAPAPAPATSPIALPAAPTLTFRGREYPTSAFRPYEPVAEHIVAAIDAATKIIHISIYQFEQQSVLDALRRAQKRGVKVEVVLDRSHVYVTGTSHEGGPRKPRPMIVELVKSGFDLMLLKGQGSGIEHNKFLIVDDELLEGGSYNYTDQSESDHFENVFFTLEKARVSHYLRYFKYMREQAEPVDMDKLEEILNRTAVAGDRRRGRGRIGDRGRGHRSLQAPPRSRRPHVQVPRAADRRGRADRVQRPALPSHDLLPPGRHRGRGDPRRRGREGVHRHRDVQLLLAAHRRGPARGEESRREGAPDAGQKPGLAVLAGRLVRLARVRDARDRRPRRHPRSALSEDAQQVRRLRRQAGRDRLVQLLAQRRAEQLRELELVRRPRDGRPLRGLLRAHVLAGHRAAQAQARAEVEAGQRRRLTPDFLRASAPCYPVRP